jgi:hypothetical protein
VGTEPHPGQLNSAAATSSIVTLKGLENSLNPSKSSPSFNDLRTHLDLIFRDAHSDRQTIEQLQQMMDVQIDNAEARSEMMVLIFDGVSKEVTSLRNNVADKLRTHYQLTENQMEYLVSSVQDVSAFREPASLK